MESKRAVLIVSHGSRSKDAVAEFNQVVNLVAQRYTKSIVRGASMELAQPDIPTAVKELVELGILHIDVVPYFLFMGNHIKNDIPQILEEQKLLYPQLEVRFGKPIGVNPLLADILIERAEELNS